VVSFKHLSAPHRDSLKLNHYNPFV
jgi:hypothetical protein